MQQHSPRAANNRRIKRWSSQRPRRNFRLLRDARWSARYLASSFARIVKPFLAIYRNKLPRILSWRQPQLQHAKRIRVAHLAVRYRRSERIVALAARAHHNLPDSVRLI